MDNIILVICNSSSGFFRLRKELIHTLISDYRIIILAPATGFVYELRELGCECIPITYDSHGINPIKEIRLIREYNKWIDKIHPSIILTYAIKPNTYAGILSKRKGIPYIVNITGLGTAVEYKSFIQIITIALYKRSLKRAHMVFFQNSENLEFMRARKLLGADNYGLLPGSGVNLEEFSAAPYPPEGMIQFAFVGRVIKEKGIDQYLDAARYYADNSKIQFHVCGDCDESYFSMLEDLHDRGVIIYHGNVGDIEDLKRVYKSINCLVHPTYYPEGLSNVILEASATARPIIATDRSGCREVVDDGINGYLVPQRNSEALIRTIESFIELPYERKREMGIAARDKVERVFDRQIVVDMYRKEIRRALDD